METVDAQIEELVAALKGLDEASRAPLLDQITALCRGAHGERARGHVESVARGQVLEIQWELEDIVEATTPPKPGEVAPEPEAAPPAPEPGAAPPEPDPNRPLTAADLEVIYDDPRGLVLHRTHAGDRWFATQVDPRTRQPQTFELHPDEIRQLKAQLANSPYWVLGQAPA